MSYRCVTPFSAPLARRVAVCIAALIGVSPLLAHPGSGSRHGEHHTDETRTTTLVDEGKLTLPTPIQPATPAAWPLQRGDTRGTGNAPITLADDYKPRWTYKAGAGIDGTAAIVDGAVYIGSVDRKLHVIDAQTGKLRWSFKADGPVEASPTVWGNVVYTSSSIGTLYALDRKTGKQLWNFEADDRIASGVTPYIAPDGARLVLVSSYDAHVYCLGAQSGEVRWKVKTENYVHGAAAVFEHKAIFGGCDGFLYLIDLDKGAVLKQIEIKGEVAAMPAVHADGTAYIGHFQHEVLGIDLRTQETRWTYYDRAFPFVGDLAISDDLVVAVSRGRRVYGIDRKTGKARWQTRVRGAIDAGAIIAGDRALVATKAGRVHILNLADGKRIWSYEVGPSIEAGPAVTQDLIVVGAQDGTVVALEPTAAARRTANQSTAATPNSGT